MCDTCIGDIGYVCSECQSEFEEYATTHNPRTEGEIRRLLFKFMETQKGDFDNGQEMSISSFFLKNQR